MKKIFVLSILILLPISNYGQVLNSCYPEFAENISDEVMLKLTKRERKEINSYNLNTDKDWSLSVNINLRNKRIFNYDDFLPIIEYTKTKGEYILEEWQLERILEKYIFSKVRDTKKCLSNIIDNRLEIINKEHREISKRIKLDTINGSYIPSDLNDAINQINLLLSEESKLEIKKMTEKEFIAESHFGIGLRLIRNGWSLWGKSRLSKYFSEKGIIHPDDMSGIILTSYYRKLIEKPIELEKQIVDIKEYHIKNSPPSKMEYPSFVTNVQWENSTGYPEDNSEENWADVHFFFSLDKKIIWIYNYNYGWKQLTKKEYRQFEKVYDYEIPNWLGKIYKFKK